MLHIPNFGVNPYLYSCVFAAFVCIIARRIDQWRIGIDYRRCKVKYATNRHGILKGGRVEGDEGGSSVCECSSGCKGEFEGLFEEEATEDHEVVSVPVLGLHDRGSLEARSIHEDDVVGLAEVIVGVYGY